EGSTAASAAVGVEKKRRALLHDLISPAIFTRKPRVGVSTSVSLLARKAIGETGCCGVFGPGPQPLWIRYSPDWDNYKACEAGRQVAARSKGAGEISPWDQILVPPPSSPGCEGRGHAD